MPLHLENAVFAFGPDGSYLFSSKTECERSKLPPTLEKLFSDNIIKEVYAAALGPNGSYFIFYKNQDSKKQYQWLLLPPRLEKWIRAGRVDAKIALGPDGSYFAWDKNGYCWHNLPEGLEGAIQSWLSEAGWTGGYPKWVSLGMNGCFWAMSTTGAWAHALDQHYAGLIQELETFKGHLGDMFGVARAMHSICLNPFVEDVYAIVGVAKGQFWKNRAHEYRDLMNIDLSMVGSSVGIPKVVKQEKHIYDNLKQNLKEKASKDAGEEEARRKKEELEAARAAEEEARRKKEESEAARAAAEARRKAEEHERLVNNVYKAWVVECEVAVQNMTTLNTFPVVPKEFCQCSEVSCLAEKMEISDGGHRACKHDVEKLLRCDVSYSASWLKQHRNMWHSNKWCRAPLEHREAFKKQADVMFVIYTQLMDDLGG